MTREEFLTIVDRELDRLTKELRESEYLVTFYENGHGSLTNDQKYKNVEYGSKTIAPALNVDGYTLEGWYTDESCSTGNKFNFDTLIKTNKNLYANWTINSYTVTFNIDCLVVDEQSINYGQKIIEPAEPEKEGFNFAGWYTDADCNDDNKWYFDLNTVTDNVVLYAKWSQKYIVQFSVGEGDVPASVTNMPINQYITPGEKALKPMEPTYDTECFVLDGWLYGDVLWNFENNTVNDNIKLTAKWTRKKYLVTFDSCGGSSVDFKRVTPNGKVSKPDNPTREGYTFDNWYTDKVNGSKYDFNNKVKSDLILYAHWKPIDYTVKFDSNEPEGFWDKVWGFIPVWKEYKISSTPTSQTKLKYLDLITNPSGSYYLTIEDDILGFIPISNKEVPDYYFTGWYKEKTCDTLWDFSSDRITGNNSTITLYAGWVNKATVNAIVIDKQLTEEQIADFNMWYARLTAHEKENFGSKETAKKYWFKYVFVEGNESASEPSIGRIVAENNMPIVHTSGAPNESEEGTENIPVGSNKDEDGEPEGNYLRQLQ